MEGSTFRQRIINIIDEVDINPNDLKQGTEKQHWLHWELDDKSYVENNFPGNFIKSKKVLVPKNRLRQIHSSNKFLRKNQENKYIIQKVYLTTENPDIQYEIGERYFSGFRKNSQSVINFDKFFNQPLKEFSPKYKPRTMITSKKKSESFTDLENLEKIRRHQFNIDNPMTLDKGFNYSHRYEENIKNFPSQEALSSINNENEEDLQDNQYESDENITIPGLKGSRNLDDEKTLNFNKQAYYDTPKRRFQGLKKQKKVDEFDHDDNPNKSDVLLQIDNQNDDYNVKANKSQGQLPPIFLKKTFTNQYLNGIDVEKNGQSLTDQTDQNIKNSLQLQKSLRKQNNNSTDPDNTVLGVQRNISKYSDQQIILSYLKNPIEKQTDISCSQAQDQETYLNSSRNKEQTKQIENTKKSLVKSDLKKILPDELLNKQKLLKITDQFQNTLKKQGNHHRFSSEDTNTTKRNISNHWKRDLKDGNESHEHGQQQFFKQKPVSPEKTIKMQPIQKMNTNAVNIDSLWDNMQQQEAQKSKIQKGIPPAIKPLADTLQNILKNSCLFCKQKIQRLQFQSTSNKQSEAQFISTLNNFNYCKFCKENQKEKEQKNISNNKRQSGNFQVQQVSQQDIQHQPSEHQQSTQLLKRKNEEKVKILASYLNQQINNGQHIRSKTIF